MSACVLALEETLLLLSDCRPISRAATSVHECLTRTYALPTIRTFANARGTLLCNAVCITVVCIYSGLPGDVHGSICGCLHLFSHNPF